MRAFISIAVEAMLFFDIAPFCRDSTIEKSKTSPPLQPQRHDRWEGASL